MTNCCASICCCVKETLILGDQQVKYKMKRPCGTQTTRRPYAELGEIVVNGPDGCGASSLLTELNGGGPGGDPNKPPPGWSPGCCDGSIVHEIADELKARQAKRGHAAQNAKLDALVVQVAALRRALAAHPPAAAAADAIVSVAALDDVLNATPLPDASFDVQPSVICTCNTHTLHLEAEGIRYEVTDCCGNTRSITREYARLGHIERKKACVCCRSVTWEGGGASPGCGFQKNKVAQILRALRERARQRGTLGQFRKQDLLLPQLEAAVAAADALCAARGVAVAPTAAPEMERGDALAERTFETTDKVQALLNCCCTCGAAGFGRESVELREDAVVFREKDNLDDSELEVPYADLDGVDFQRSCCCCYEVNGETPGWGCERATAEELTRELHLHTVAKGDIKQLRQLERIDALASALEAKLGALAAAAAPAPPPLHADVVRAFEPNAYNFTDPCESASVCWNTCGLAGPVTRRTVDLEADELVVHVSNWCSTSTARTPYSQMDGVDVDESCCVCYELDGVGGACVGCGDAELRSIAAELEARIEKRGDIAQIKLQDNTLHTVGYVLSRFEGDTTTLS